MIIENESWFDHFCEVDLLSVKENRNHPGIFLNDSIVRRILNTRPGCAYLTFQSDI
jgi:hypothetical protein